MMPAQTLSSRQRGFTYLGLIILIAILGMVSASTLHLGAMMHRRAAEQELLERGLALSLALESYARGAHGTQKTEPDSVNDLLRDPRSPKVLVRHLRRIEPDPITGRTQWGEIRGPGGQGIVGFYSLTEQEPLKTTDFPDPFGDFEGKRSYKEWVFKSGMGE